MLRDDELSATTPSKCVGPDLHNVTGRPDRCTTKKAVSPYCLLSTMKLGLEQIRIHFAFERPNAVILALYGERGSSAYASDESSVFRVQSATFHLCGNLNVGTSMLNVVKQSRSMNVRYTHSYSSSLDMIAIIGTSDQPCWLARSCKIFLFSIWSSS